MGEDESGFDRRAEVDALLEGDETWLGDVWKRDRDGRSVQDIADEYKITVNPVYAYLQLLRALREGEMTASPSVASKHASRFRTWLKNPDLSPGLRAILASQLLEFEAVAANTVRREQEDQVAAQLTEEVESQGRAGIYVYTLPHYVRYPFEPETGKTLLKVGHSARDAFYRAGSQGRLTALPEDPVLLRVYPADESALVEREFHAWLLDADHARSEARRGGREWFVTSTRFLDRVARSLGLEIVTYNETFDPADS
jgi:hypothetical protein